MDAIIIDTETTDKDPKTCEVVESAYREFHFDPLTAISPAVRCLYGYARDLKWGAMAAHHILPEEVQGLPLFEPASFHAALAAIPYLIGHNIDFDWQAIGSPRTHRRICTLAMARDLWPQLDSHTLTALIYFTQGASKETRERLRSAHSAVADVIFCEDILRVIVAEKGITDFESLYAYSEESRIPKIMAFGKFRGQPVTNVDRGYANWYRRQDETDPYVIEAFRRCGLL